MPLCRQSPTFNVIFPTLEFTNSSTAGPAIFNAFNTGPMDFRDISNAGTATIISGDASRTLSPIPTDSLAVSFSSGQQHGC